jgi:predicted protein tyrosine phosphatase
MELPFQLTVCGIGELTEPRERVTHIVSILDPETPVPPELTPYQPHQRLELRFHDVIDDAPGMQAPQPEHIQRLLAFTRAVPAAHVLVHCHAGFSRSPASAILMLAQAWPDVPAHRIILEVLRLRGNVWPNLLMLEIGDRLLDRKGDILAAVRQLYRHCLERDPSLAVLIRAVGRARELELAAS